MQRDTSRDNEMMDGMGGWDGRWKCLPLAVVVGVLAPREVVVVSSRGLRGGGGRGSCPGCNGDGRSRLVGRRRGDTNFVQRAEDLANVDIRAVAVDLGVVCVEDGGVDASVGGDDVTRVIRRHDVRVRAILACGTQADCLADAKVVTRRVDGGVVNSRELICGCVVGRGDAVASVARDDGVVSGTVGWQALGSNKGESRDGCNDEGGEHICRCGW